VLVLVQVTAPVTRSALCALRPITPNQYRAKQVAMLADNRGHRGHRHNVIYFGDVFNPKSRPIPSTANELNDVDVSNIFLVIVNKPPAK